MAGVNRRRSARDECKREGMLARITALEMHRAVSRMGGVHRRVVGCRRVLVERESVLMFRVLVIGVVVNVQEASNSKRS